MAALSGRRLLRSLSRDGAQLVAPLAAGAPLPAPAADRAALAASSVRGDEEEGEEALQPGTLEVLLAIWRAPWRHGRTRSPTEVGYLLGTVLIFLLAGVMLFVRERPPPGAPAMQWIAPKRPDGGVGDWAVLAARLGPPNCLRAPRCLEPAGRCLGLADAVRLRRAECLRSWELCEQSLFELPTTGVLTTLPEVPVDELAKVWLERGSARHVGGEGDQDDDEYGEIASRSDEVGEASKLLGVALANRSGLTVADVGCKRAELLLSLRGLAGNDGHLMCFSGAPLAGTASEKQRNELEQRLARGREGLPGLDVRMWDDDFNTSLFEPESVDLLLSRRVVEFAPDPCVVLDAYRHVLRPGGLVFVEVAQPTGLDETSGSRGPPQLSFFTALSFEAMMTGSGWERVGAICDIRRR
eukprot:TRINITY_DN7816_c0_g1_i4.p1 TRINITY_DN7816_c0_g1~~TRINITY_DN7816_c0_g1_i4.p1  ORF type:complete len:412 (+),score=72.81 TRINITY_DN7816_c0_g1_i4:67-1302(+)